MLVRVITAVCIAAVLIPVAFLSHTVVFPIVIAAFAGMGCFEMLRCIGMHKNLFITVPAVLCGIGLPFASFYLPEQAFMLLSSLSAVLMFVLFTVSLFSHGKVPIEQAGMAFIALVYILWGFTLMVLLRRINNGEYLYLMPFLGAWVSDSFAYFTGRLFGRNKLIPDVSPKKTVEGAIGGIVFAMASFGKILKIILISIVALIVAFLLFHFFRGFIRGLMS